MTDPYIGSVIDGRYEIVKPLGAGAMGAVYLARQVMLDRPVAIKVLRPDVPVDSRARRRLHREARVVGRLSNPHVVQVHDYGQTDAGSPYLVMEYVRGTTPEQTLVSTTDLGAVLAAIDGVLTGLGAAHASGALHRDLKPANMIVRDGDPNQVVLLDFGIAAVLNQAQSDPEITLAVEMLARETADEELTRAGTVMGTPLYMSPEQARGTTVTERSDLYAAGVVLYQWLAGQTPFRGPIRHVMRAHVFDLPPPLVPRPGLQVPEALIQVVHRSLAKSPADRFGSAGEMRRAIRRSGGPPREGARPMAAGSAPGAAVLPPRVADTMPVAALTPTLEADPQARSGVWMAADPVFIDRDREVSWLRTRIAECIAGKGSVVLVEGADGLGKTRLVRHVLDEAGARGTLRIGRAAASPGGGPALHLVRASLEDLMQSRRLSPDGLAQRLKDVIGGHGEGLSGDECDHLARWLRGAESVETTGPVRPESPLEWHEQALIERALRVLGGSIPIVLWLDDLHWADAATTAFLTRCAIAQRLEPFPLLIVATRDPNQTEDAFALHRYGGQEVHRLELAGLSAAELEAMLHSLMPLDRAVAAQLASRAAGSPLHALQLLRHVAEQGWLHARDGEWTLAEDVEPSGLVPASIEQVLGARLEGVAAHSQDAAALQQLMEAAAVLGSSFEVELLEGVLAAAGVTLDGEGLDARLDELVDGGVLLEPGGGNDRLQWEHPMLRDLVLSRMGKSRRSRRLCRAAADALLAEHPVREVARPVVELLLLAGAREAAAGYAAEGGEQALAAGELGEAIRLFELARKRGDREVRIRACYGQGNAENHLGRTDRAEDAFAAILDEDPRPLEAAWAWFGVGRCRYNRGESRKALEALRQSLGLVDGQAGAQAARVRSKALRTLAAAAAELPDVAVPDPDVEAFLADAVGPMQRCEHFTTLGYVALRRGDRAAARKWLDSALEEAHSGGEHPALPDILCDLGRACREAGDLTAADRHLHEGLDLAHAAGQHRSEAELRNELGELERARGDLAAATRHYRGAVTLWKLLGSRHVLVGSLNQALVSIDTGVPREALEVLEELDVADDDPWHPALLLTRALALATAGEHTPAAEALEEGVALQARYAPPHDEAASIVRRVGELWTADGSLVLASRAETLAKSLQVSSSTADG
ncbi:MAG: protein kinase [Proteobacteria bacterium]|nr:protein kinase [Pseudomonadota bacterium]